MGKKTKKTFITDSETIFSSVNDILATTQSKNYFFPKSLNTSTPCSWSQYYKPGLNVELRQDLSHGNRQLKLCSASQL